jgi:phospholipid transport system substrate-binding protein
MKIKRSQIWRSAVALIPAFFLCFSSFAVAAVSNPEAAVQTGTNEVLQLLRENPRDASIRHKIHAVVDNYFDFHEIAKRALGREWKRQPPEKREQFTKAFSRLLFNTYIGKIENYSDQSISYALIQRGAHYAVVRAYVYGAQNMAPIPIDYYLRLEGGNWKVYDVVIDGLGLVANYRDQFNSILATTSFEGLLRQLEARNTQG